VNGRVNLISLAAYARRRGCAKSAVSKAVSEGRISLINGKIDPEVADFQWKQNTRARADSGRSVDQAGLHEGQGGLAGDVPSEPGFSPAPAEPDYHSLRARRELAAVEREERENAKEAGRLIDRDTTERAIFDAFRALRDAVMAAGQRAAPKLIGLIDVRDIERVIADEQRKAFAGWEERMLERLPAREGA